jgi:S-DNA-T family DNA segregation ATPase FtsK/SpoIIIE
MAQTAFVPRRTRASSDEGASALLADLTPEPLPAVSRSPRAAKPAGSSTRAASAKAPEAREAADSPEAIEPGGARPSAEPRAPWGREAGALLCVVAALYSTLALGSYEADPMRPEVAGPDWVGPVGATVASWLAGSVGVASWFVPFELGVLAAPLIAGERSRATATRLAGDLVVVMVGAALCQVLFPRSRAFGELPVGGAVGELFGELMRTLFSPVGSVLLGTTVILLILIGRAEFSFIAWAERAKRLAARVEGWTRGRAERLADAWSAAAHVEAASSPLTPPSPDTADALIAALADDLSDLDPDRRSPTPDEPFVLALVGKRGAVESVARSADDLPAEPAPAPALSAAALAPGSAPALPVPSPGPAARAPRARGRAPSAQATPPSPSAEPSVVAPGLALSTAAREPPPPAPPAPAAAPASAPASASVADPAILSDGIRIVDTSAALSSEKAAPAPRAPEPLTGFRLPSIELLDAPKGGKLDVDRARLAEVAQLLEKTLADYGVSGKVEEIQPGPTVTTFEVVPAAGTKVSKVASLADDLALGLSRKVRIVAPIPGKNRIGFEVPNDKRLPVSLRELVEDKRFADMTEPLPCVLGRDIIGAPFFADLASMPHVIVAGATGAGKSVGLNVMLVSLLFRRTPSELRMLMVDPKVVELAPFDGIPHMLLPVVTDMKQAANAMKWAVDEMERRYQLFAQAGTKNIGTYNGWVERVRRGEAKPPKGPSTVMAIAPDGNEVEVSAARDGSDATLPEKLPWILIVIDEFADLMMQQGKDVEASVARLAQKARAAGMHVILATQRPSVDVITGMIKANFPTRIAFRVAQKVDSRTILDEQGAEHLLGRGDMLVKLNGLNDTRRVQGPFCTEEEVQRVCDYLRSQGTPTYDESILKPRDEDGAPVAEDAEQDPMYDAAVRVVADTRRCSTSWIQRKLGIGYNRAAKIVEMMELRGVVGPANGAKDREVLVSPL